MMSVQDRIITGYYETKTTFHKEVLKFDILKELGLSNHPEKDGIFEKAWSEGIRNGVMGVYHELNSMTLEM
jgi:hypothetical protein